MRLIIISISIFILLTGCKKEEPIDELNYLTGQILFMPSDSVPMIDIYNLVDSLDLNINELKNCRYTYKGASDSILVLKSYLDNKDYLTNNGNTFSFIVSDTIAKINLTFFQINDSVANDWLNTKSIFNLIENYENTIQSWSSLKVPEGSENYWVDVIVLNDIIESASLNHIFISH